MWARFKNLLRRKKNGVDPTLAADFDMAMQMLRYGDGDTAVALLQKCIAASPRLPEPYFFSGQAHERMGRQPDAITAYRDYLAHDPADSMGAAIRLHLLGQTQQPDHLPTPYIARLFDGFAGTYDDTMLHHLSYTAPRVLADALRTHHPAPFARALDLGCGTGLCAQALGDVAPVTDGVDLSTAMLARARAKNLYATLHHADIAAFLGNAAQRYDLVVAADVFVYLGALDNLLPAIAHILQPDGYLAFTVQDGTQDRVTLGTDHRYAHPRGHIDACARKAGLTLISATPAILRYEYGEPVASMVYLLKS